MSSKPPALRKSPIAISDGFCGFSGTGTASMLIGPVGSGATGLDCGAAQTPAIELTTTQALSHDPML